MARSGKERESFANLEAFARERISAVKTEYRWTNEDIGRSITRLMSAGPRSLPDCYLVATGFNAWGITNGTGGRDTDRRSDRGSREKSSWLKVFDATRIKPVPGAKEFVAGNAATASHLVGGYLARKAARLPTIHRRGGDPQDRRPQCRWLSGRDRARFTPCRQRAPYG